MPRSKHLQGQPIAPTPIAIESLRMDRATLSVVPLFDESDEKTYWHLRTPQERLHQIEILRLINYGFEATARLQRVLEVAPRPWR